MTWASRSENVVNGLQRRREPYCPFKEKTGGWIVKTRIPNCILFLMMTERRAYCVVLTLIIIVLFLLFILSVKKKKITNL